MFKFSIVDFVQSDLYKKITKKIYGFGAAIVIIGALFKILHLPGGGPVLVVGMSIEALIFILSAFEPPDEEIDWTLVYPELAGINSTEEAPDFPKKGKLQTDGKQIDHAILPGTNGKQNSKVDMSAYKIDCSTENNEYTTQINEQFKTLQTVTGKFNSLFENYVQGMESSEDYFDILQEGKPILGKLSYSIHSFSRDLTETKHDMTLISDTLKTFIEEYKDIKKELQISNQGLNHINSDNKHIISEYYTIKDELQTLRTSINSLNKYYSNMISAISSVESK
jgi:gliding motility-associated protein GldL